MENAALLRAIIQNAIDDIIYQHTGIHASLALAVKLSPTLSDFKDEGLISKKDV